jgi:hypothetical protein
MGELRRAAAAIFFVSLGFEEIANLAEEAMRPMRDWPRPPSRQSSFPVPKTPLPGLVRKQAV